jgi:hypothetical protein
MGAVDAADDTRISFQRMAFRCVGAGVERVLTVVVHRASSDSEPDHADREEHTAGRGQHAGNFDAATRPNPVVQR